MSHHQLNSYLASSWWMPFKATEDCVTSGRRLAWVVGDGCFVEDAWLVYDIRFKMGG